MHILMIASENDAIKGAKVGGVADVVRDAPRALANFNHHVSVIIPDYANYAEQFGHCTEAHFYVAFAGQMEEVILKKLGDEHHNVQQYVISHPSFITGSVYLNDIDNRPFARDATKYAFFCAAIAEAITLDLFAPIDVVHLHDWHSAVFAVLAKYSERYQPLTAIKQVFTVHNIALQGIRPFRYDSSSLEAWFPALSYDGQVICDPRYPHCFNPMRAAINLVDKVHVVSKTYADEVLLPSQPERGFFGGEGLEQDLINAKVHGKLVGIINGCEYPEHDEVHADFDAFLRRAKYNVFNWMAKSVELKTVQYLANERINEWLANTSVTGPIFTSIGRLTDQKVLLLRQTRDHVPVLSTILSLLAQANGRLVILGSGDSQIEFEFMQLMAKHNNFLFLNGYGQDLSDELYGLGDLFLMPSSFEPCGISQMLALRAGQPCLVHGVGGLKDTIIDNETGFVFFGDNLNSQIDGLLEKVSQAIECYQHDQTHWQQLITNAKQARFGWHQSAEQYIQALYQN